MILKKRYLGLVLVVLLLFIPCSYAVDSYSDDSFATKAHKALWNAFYFVYSSMSESTITGFVVAQDGALVGTLDLNTEEPEPILEPKVNETDSKAPLQEEPPESELSDLIETTTELIETAEAPEVTDEGIELVEKLQEKINELSDESNLPNLSGTSGETESNTTQDEHSVSPELSFNATSDEVSNTTSTDVSEANSSASANSSLDTTEPEQDDPMVIIPVDNQNTSSEEVNNTMPEVVEEASIENATEGFDVQEQVEPDQDIAPEEPNLQPGQEDSGEQPDQAPTEQPDQDNAQEEPNLQPGQEDSGEQPDQAPTEQPDQDNAQEEPNLQPGQEDSGEQPDQAPTEQPDQDNAQEELDSLPSTSLQEPIAENESVPVDIQPFIQLLGAFKVGEDITINVNPDEYVTNVVVTYDEVAYEVNDGIYTIPADGDYVVTALIEMNGVTSFVEETFTTIVDVPNNPTFIENILEDTPVEEIEAERIEFTKKSTDVDYIHKWESEIQGPKKIILPANAFNIIVAKKEEGLAQLSGQSIYKPYDPAIEVNGIEKSLSTHNEETTEVYEERKQEFEEGNEISGYVVNRVGSKAGLIPRMLDRLYTWLFSGGITGNVVGVGAPDTVLEIGDGLYAISYETIEYVVDPTELDETYTCDFEDGSSITIVENMACFGLDVHLDEIVVAPQKSVVFKNSNVVVDSATLDGTLHLEGELAHFIINSDMQVNAGGKLVMNHSNLVLNATESVNPTFNLVPGAKMVVTRNSKITNGVNYGGADNTFQFIINAREYRLR